MVRQYQNIVVVYNIKNPDADTLWGAFHYDRTLRKTVSFTGYEADEPGSIFRFEATVLELSEVPGGDPNVLHMTLDVTLKGRYKGVYNASERTAILTPV